MAYQIGDKVIHWTYGLGEIKLIEEKIIHGRLTNCYVVQISDLTIWVPIDDLKQNSLRLPTPPNDFERLFTILTSPGETLLEDRMLRKTQLIERMKDGQLASICQVVRDLTHFQRVAKLNDQERSILERAIQSLLAEWTYSLGTPFNQAHQAMVSMLGG
jgi:RNA polymerase-interacting CarD/CdnL/TRCF family regulator